ncbi:MAG TPA: T9SS type A sorting domain-containing protein, partial [Saprospiraceae bacterium]|nr:T9SS type A sorting domain-containing protein [Saprospiraceae bacterium]
IERTLLSVDQPSTQPPRYDLVSVYPNPFNPITNIEYNLRTFSEFELDLYDLLGRQIQNLDHGMKPPGKYSMRFDGAHLASGVYVVVLRTRMSFTTSRIVIAK